MPQRPHGLAAELGMMGSGAAVLDERQRGGKGRRGKLGISAGNRFVMHHLEQS